MADSARSGQLQALVEDIDRKLLALLEGAAALDERQLRRVALLETARNAALRLLAREIGADRP